MRCLYDAEHNTDYGGAKKERIIERLFAVVICIVHQRLGSCSRMSYIIILALGRVAFCSSTLWIEGTVGD